MRALENLDTPVTVTTPIAEYSRLPAEEPPLCGVNPRCLALPAPKVHPGTRYIKTKTESKKALMGWPKEEKEPPTAAPLFYIKSLSCLGY